VIRTRKGIVMKSVLVAFIAVGLATGSTFLVATISQAYAKQPFVGGAIVTGGTISFYMLKCSIGPGLRETHGFYFSAHTRDGILVGHWDFASQFAGAENKGGTIYDGKSDGKTYELKGKETHDGICHAKVPKDVIISGQCGKGVTINYKTINGLSHTLTGDVKCLGHTT